MALEMIENDGVTLIRLAGDLKNELSTELKQKLLELLRAGKNCIVINLAGVKFIHSFGIAVLVKGKTRASSEGGDVKFSCLSRYIKDLFAMVRLDKVFAIFETEEEAVAEFGVGNAECGMKKKE